MPEEGGREGGRGGRGGRGGGREGGRGGGGGREGGREGRAEEGGEVDGCECHSEGVEVFAEAMVCNVPFTCQNPQLLEQKHLRMHALSV